MRQRREIAGPGERDKVSAWLSTKWSRAANCQRWSVSAATTWIQGRSPRRCVRPKTCSTVRDAVSDWPFLNAFLNSASGATWASFHYGRLFGHCAGWRRHGGSQREVIVYCGTIRRQASCAMPMRDVSQLSSECRKTDSIRPDSSNLNAVVVTPRSDADVRFRSDAPATADRIIATAPQADLRSSSATCILSNARCRLPMSG